MAAAPTAPTTAMAMSRSVGRLQVPVLRRPVPGVGAPVRVVDGGAGELVVGRVVEAGDVHRVKGAAELGKRPALGEGADAAPVAEEQMQERLGQWGGVCR